MSQKRIKILYTIPNFDTAGSGKVVYDLVKNLDRSIFEPEICCFHKNGSFIKEVEKLDVKIHQFNFAINYRPFFSFPFRLLKIIRFFKKYQFDIIHSWHWSSDFSEPLAAKLAGIPFVYTKKSMGWGNKAWKWRSKLSSKIITINRDMLSLFFKGMCSKTSYIPIGIDLNYYFPQDKVYRIPEGHKFDSENLTIVSIGNLLPIKGISFLVEAINEMNDQKLKLLIVGNDSGTYAARMKKLASSNLKIIFLGKKIDIRPYLAVSELIIVPTTKLGEGLGVVAIEAMASQRIVIGSNVSGIKDILQPFPTCLFEPNNVGSLKESISIIIGMSQEKRDQLAKEMRVHVENEYSLVQFIDKHTELYKKMIV